MSAGHQRKIRLPLTVVGAVSIARSAILTCDGCGACCRSVPVPPYLDEIDFIPRALQEQVFQARLIEAELERQGRPCIWLDAPTGKCTQHQHRPNICREYETGGELCLETRAMVGIA